MKEKGVSLVELVLVVAAVAFLALLINNLPSALSSINRSRHASLAREVVSRQIDYLRKQSYGNLSNGSSSFTDSGLVSLPSSSASYEIEDCSPEICTNQEAVKRVRVTVGWNESGDAKTVEVTTFIGEGGLAQ